MNQENPCSKPPVFNVHNIQSHHPSWIIHSDPHYIRWESPGSWKLPSQLTHPHCWVRNNFIQSQCEDITSYQQNWLSMMWKCSMWKIDWCGKFHGSNHVFYLFPTFLSNNPWYFPSRFLSNFTQKANQRRLGKSSMLRWSSSDDDIPNMMGKS